MAKIFIYDEFSPEDTAMMQALYSRSPLSVEEHAKKVKATGSGKFMETFYVGYGHLSIADCGSTTIFIEGLSILADKAVQDWPLYSGQETSTRYVDMSKQPIVDPVGTIESKQIQENWMEFYISAMPRLQKFLKEKHTIEKDQEQSIYDKAINARSFDIMRSFLPAGITTQLSWHTNLRQAWDKLAIMRHHPLSEVREIAENILIILRKKYPHSFSHGTYPGQTEYREACMSKYNYYETAGDSSEFSFTTTIDPDRLAQYRAILDIRPGKTNLPLFLFELGLCTFEFLLDMGSFRDIQRHRNGFCRQPLLTTKYGFNEWYLSELPPDLGERAKKLIGDQIKRLDALSTSREIKQYYIAMGFNMPCRVTYGLPATVYTVELRSGQSVHPTLRKIALQMHDALKKKFPFLPLHCDLEPSQWDIKRGNQDIVEKK
ncbi:MAG: FAD-dependent thymidylate synthase [Planctomycetes bacterium]|nr:FAD-dependent thymidylate synthase [Planctomycetota bacterium]